MEQRPRSRSRKREKCERLQFRKRKENKIKKLTSLPPYWHTGIHPTIASCSALAPASASSVS